MSQGKGIFLTRHYEGIDRHEHCVVQRYLHKPFLIEGLKFDLRVYVMVFGVDPLRIFLFHEGLVRFATEAYTPPVGTNLGNMFMHLTNYAINKENEKFEFNNDEKRDDVGHKRSLTWFLNYLDEQGLDRAGFQRGIKDIIVKTMIAVQPSLRHLYRTNLPDDVENSQCFEILGFDVFVDDKLKPWLLEVNHSPSFVTDTPLDYKIKHQLICNVITMLNMNLKRKRNYKIRQRQMA